MNAKLGGVPDCIMASAKKRERNSIPIVKLDVLVITAVSGASACDVRMVDHIAVFALKNDTTKYKIASIDTLKTSMTLFKNQNDGMYPGRLKFDDITYDFNYIYKVVIM